MKVYVIVEYYDEESTYIEDVYQSEDAAREYILNHYRDAGLDVADGEWRIRGSSGGYSYELAREPVPYRHSPPYVYLVRDVILEATP